MYFKTSAPIITITINNILLIILNKVALINSQNQKLFGGVSAKMGQFPHMVSIQDKDSYHICGGSIINDRSVLTAHHCLLHQFYYAYVGSIDLTGSGTRYIIDKALTYEESLNFEYDICILLIEGSFTFNDYVKPISLPSKDYIIVDVQVAGWGYLLDWAQSLILKYINTTTVSDEACGKDSHNYICTYIKEGVGNCYGDSGGPIMTNGEIIGIVSRVVPCALGAPDINTRVYQFIDWIKQNWQ